MTLRVRTASESPGKQKAQKRGSGALGASLTSPPNMERETTTPALSPLVRSCGQKLCSGRKSTLRHAILRTQDEQIIHQVLLGYLPVHFPNSKASAASTTCPGISGYYHLYLLICLPSLSSHLSSQTEVFCVCTTSTSC